MNHETTIRNAIRDTLLRIGVLVMTNAQVGRTFHGGLGTGSPDLVAVVKGRFVGLEVKVPGEKPSPNQVAWGEQLKQHGGSYFVVCSVAEAILAVRTVSAETQTAKRAIGDGG